MADNDSNDPPKDVTPPKAEGDGTEQPTPYYIAPDGRRHIDEVDSDKINKPKS